LILPQKCEAQAHCFSGNNQWSTGGVSERSKILQAWLYLAIENLIFRARSVLNGFAGKESESLGVPEYWRIGALAKGKALIST
jgi:hypothetical protein